MVEMSLDKQGLNEVPSIFLVISFQILNLGCCLSTAYTSHNIYGQKYVLVESNLEICSLLIAV